MEKKDNSVSLNTGYPSICLEASKNDDVFNIFKTIPEYVQILEHTSIEFGEEYIKIIKRDNPHLLEEKYLNKFKGNDNFGGSMLHDFGDFTISPSTLRYIKVLSDLIKLFGDLSNFRIVEIGGGYGGQCKIINDYFTIKDYHIVDLYEATLLTKKYLDKLSVNNVRFSTSDKLNEEKYDLIISNYAYTELDRGLQNNYKDNIINGSENGYITCNFIIDFVHSGQFDTYSETELLNLNNKIKVLPEEPLTAPTNFIAFWKK